MFEPQYEIYNFIKEKYKNNESIRIYNKALSEKKRLYIFNFNKHDLTSSLSTLDKNNSYLKLKAKLFGTDTEGMIEKKVKIETVTLHSIMDRRSNRKR